MLNRLQKAKGAAKAAGLAVQANALRACCISVASSSGLRDGLRQRGCCFAASVCLFHSGDLPNRLQKAKGAACGCASLNFSFISSLAIREKLTAFVSALIKKTYEPPLLTRFHC